MPRVQEPLAREWGALEPRPHVELAAVEAQSSGTYSDLGKEMIVVSRSGTVALVSRGKYSHFKSRVLCCHNTIQIIIYYTIGPLPIAEREDQQLVRQSTRTK